MRSLPESGETLERPMPTRVSLQFGECRLRRFGVSKAVWFRERRHTLFARRDDPTKARGGWSRLNLRQRAERTYPLLLDSYDLVHEASSKVIHGTIGGVLLQLRPEPSGGALWQVPPSPDHCAVALQHGHHALLFLVTALADLFDLILRPDVSQLTQDYLLAWHPGELDAGPSAR
jgi:hypothetical protein